MAISPSRISTATQYQNLHRTGAASSQCVQLIDKMLQSSDYYRADPDKVKLTYIVDTLTKIEILNSDYMKELLAKQIKEAYVEAGWKDAYIVIEYREDEYVNRRGEPQWISVHSLEVELYFFQDSDNQTEEASASTGENIPQHTTRTGEYRLAAMYPVTDASSIIVQALYSTETGNPFWQAVPAEEQESRRKELIAALVVPEEAIPAETKQTVTMPDTVQIVGKDITISSGDTITITIDKPIVQGTVQPVGFIPAGTPTGEYRIVSDDGGTVQRAFHDGFGDVYWSNLNHLQAQEFITEVTQLTINAALRVFAPAGTPI